MSLEIKQSLEQIRHSSVLTRNAGIQNIRVISGNYRRIADDDLLAKVGQSLQVEVFFKPSRIKVLDHRLYAEASFECKVVPDSKDADLAGACEVLKIECVLEAIYLLREDYSPSDLELNAFREGNAIFHCWPYFREFVQNSAVRMDFPPPPIPFLRVSLSSKQVEKLNSPKPLKGKGTKSIPAKSSKGR
jgi:hypothetical protein